MSARTDLDLMRQALDAIVASGLSGTKTKQARAAAAAALTARLDEPVQPVCQPLTERAILDLMPTTIPASMDGELLWFARAIERECAALWGVTLGGIGQEGGAD